MKTLVYTVTRAEGAPRVLAAFESLRAGQKTAGTSHDWLLWANSPDVWKASELGWAGMRQCHEGGDNVGQHIPLRYVLNLARAENYDFIAKVDDDLTWETSNWLRKLLQTDEAVYAYSGKHAVLAPRVLGLINPIPSIKITMDGIKLHAVSIAGGACRLHHISFFEGYEPDCRRALGAGGDTTIATHAEQTHIPIFLVHKITVRHDTKAQIAADPANAKLHGVFQRIPFIPAWRPPEGTA